MCPSHPPLSACLSVKNLKDITMCCSQTTTSLFSFLFLFPHLRKAVKRGEQRLLCKPFHCPGHRGQTGEQTDFDNTRQLCQNNLANSYQRPALPRTGSLAHHVTIAREIHVPTRGGEEREVTEDCTDEGLGTVTWAEPPGSHPPHGPQRLKCERTQCR